MHRQIQVHAYIILTTAEDLFVTNVLTHADMPKCLFTLKPLKPFICISWIHGDCCAKCPSKHDSVDELRGQPQATHTLKALAHFI